MNPDVVPVPGTTALMALIPCPGRQHTLMSLAGVSGTGAQDELRRLAGWGAHGMLTLMASGELQALGLGALGDEAREAGLRWWHMPITDFSAPGRHFESAWRQHGEDILTRLLAGQHLAIHCLAGLGRTGTVAARILIELGESPEDAIRRVRQGRPGTIQSDEQLNYILQRQWR